MDKVKLLPWSFLHLVLRTFAPVQDRSFYMVKDKIILVILSLSALAVLIFSFEQSGIYPFLTTVLIIFAFSLISFFAFMTKISRAWYYRIFTVNFILIVLLPIVEGMNFLLISVILLAVLALTQLAFYLIQKK